MCIHFSKHPQNTETSHQTRKSEKVIPLYPFHTSNNIPLPRRDISLLHKVKYESARALGHISSPGTQILSRSLPLPHLHRQYLISPPQKTGAREMECERERQMKYDGRGKGERYDA